MDDVEERIRKRAYEIWEREGRPHGRDSDHWLQARDEVLKELPAAERAEAKAQVPEKPPASLKRAKAAAEKKSDAAPSQKPAKPKKAAAGGKSASGKQSARSKA